MKILAMVDFVFLPLTFMTGVYGMNFKQGMLELNYQYGYMIFWMICLTWLMISVFWFYQKKWIVRRPTAAMLLPLIVVYHRVCMCVCFPTYRTADGPGMVSVEATVWTHVAHPTTPFRFISIRISTGSLGASLQKSSQSRNEGNRNGSSVISKSPELGWPTSTFFSVGGTWWRLRFE
jgi:hypothetical protein